MKDEIRKDSDLNLKTSNYPVLSIELDLDSIELAGYDGSYAFLKYALASYAKENPDTTATIYSFENMSVNSGLRHWTVFLGVVGNHKEEVRYAIQFAFTSFTGVPDSIIQDHRKNDLREDKEIWVRNPSDHIQLDFSTQLYHIEDGRVWMEREPFSWHSLAEWAKD